MKPFNQNFAALGTSIFAVMSALAVKHGAVNLGQGFPDGGGPDDVRQVAADKVLNGPHQYPPFQGVPELRQAVADHDRRFYGLNDLTVDNVLVTSGATEALAAAFLGLLNPGDEAIVIEPGYDSYRPMITAAGGTVRAITLSPPHWRLTEDHLRAVFTERTKLIVVNDPMNPSGKVFSDDELALIAEYCVRFNAFAVCDEVYEHLLFDGRRHRPLLTFDGMAERAIKIGSAGKTFSLTGWKVGYVTAAPEVVAMLSKVHQFLTFTTPPNLQLAVAYGLAKEDDYFYGLRTEMQQKRDRLSKGLAAVGFKILPCEGTYFLVGDYGALAPGMDSLSFCRMLTEEALVTAVPLDAFYGDAAGEPLVRFCFAKNDETLDVACRQLASFFQARGLPEGGKTSYA